MIFKNAVRFTLFFIIATFLTINQGCATQRSSNQVKSDLEITQDIRQAIIANQTLSLYAHNVKIISNNGIVKLRGPVTSAEERAVVVSIASHATGTIKILDQMSVASK